MKQFVDVNTGEVDLARGQTIIRSLAIGSCIVVAANIESTAQLLNDKNIPIRATALGGTKRKSIFLDVETGAASCIIGDGRQEDLWKATIS